MMLKRDPASWYEEAMQRKVSVPETTLKKRIKVAEKLRQLATESGVYPTKDMVADEMLLITGRMDKEEFNQYFALKNGLSDAKR